VNVIEEAYEKNRDGSKGFCKYIAAQGGVELSRSEIKRIASVAPNASAFMRVWGEEIWWLDQ
jgi:hypothetical protein